MSRRVLIACLNSSETSGDGAAAVRCIRHGAGDRGRARYGLGRGGDWGLAVCMCMPHPACGRARMGHGCVWAERVGRGQAESSRGARANEQPFVRAANLYSIERIVSSCVFAFFGIQDSECDSGSGFAVAPNEVHGMCFRNCGQIDSVDLV